MKIRDKNRNSFQKTSHRGTKRTEETEEDNKFALNAVFFVLWHLREEKYVSFIGNNRAIIGFII